MMKRPADMTSTPRGDWTYRQPETDMPFRAQHPKVLEAEVLAHRMSLPDLHMDTASGWRVRLWNAVCEQNPNIPYEDTEEPRYFPSLLDVWRFIQTMWNWRTQGGEFVPQEEAERRANICLTGANGQRCQYNQVFAPCLGCHGYAEDMDRLVEGRKTSRDAELHICTACGGCRIPVKIHFPLESLSVDESKLPPWCWQKKN